jgi:hypothetical protein
VGTCEHGNDVACSTVCGETSCLSYDFLPSQGGPCCMGLEFVCLLVNVLNFRQGRQLHVWVQAKSLLGTQQVRIG